MHFVCMPPASGKLQDCDGHFHDSMNSSLKKRWSAWSTEQANPKDNMKDGCSFAECFALQGQVVVTFTWLVNLDASTGEDAAKYSKK